jgi:signal transduction histidine kinase
MPTKTVRNILIVDDEPEIGRTLEEFLASEGFAVSLVCDGATALDMLILEKNITLVLLDINMPGLGGITVLKHIQATGSDTAVIMMSGYGSEELAVECMRNGAEDYISKPFAFEDLLQRIERAHAHRSAQIEKRLLQQEKEDFILMLSHDMKNPLTAAIGSIDIIREGCLGPVNIEQKEYLQAGIDSCNEVVTMIDNLLDIRRFEAGKLPFVLLPHTVHELISTVVAQYSQTARHDGIELTLALESCTAEIAVDKSAFKRVIGNLLGNSLKFTPEEGSITVSCRCISGHSAHALNIPVYVALPPGFLETGCYVRVAVGDTGSGIAPDELERIFERFTQLSRRTGRERGGAGLGLAYCKLAMESFHGTIWAECATGEGSEFVVLLPCCAEKTSDCHTIY